MNSLNGPNSPNNPTGIPCMRVYVPAQTVLDAFLAAAGGVVKVESLAFNGANAAAPFLIRLLPGPRKVAEDKEKKGLES